MHDLLELTSRSWKPENLERLQRTIGEIAGQGTATEQAYNRRLVLALYELHQADAGNLVIIDWFSSFRSVSDFKEQWVRVTDGLLTLRQEIDDIAAYADVEELDCLHGFFARLAYSGICQRGQEVECQLGLTEEEWVEKQIELWNQDIKLRNVGIPESTSDVTD